MAAARAQIRRPLDSRAQVTISVVDTSGNILGVVRGPDAPLFGTDVSLQKARTAAFFSSATAGAELSNNNAADATIRADIRANVPAARAFFNDPNALTGQFAFSDRANGNVSRPYFPDGELGRPPGPFSRPIAEFNPFSTGLQSALIVENVFQHVGFILGAQRRHRAAMHGEPDSRPARQRHPDLPGLGSRLSRQHPRRRHRRLGRRHRPGRHDQLPRRA